MNAALLKARIRTTRRNIEQVRKHIARLEALNVRRHKELVRLLHPAPSVMFDSVTVSAIPAGAPAVAGYVGGNWPTYHELTQRFPDAHHLSIAVNAGEDAQCLDIETGDATPAQAPGWVRRQHARGVKRPCLYANLSTMPAVIAALRAAGIPRKSVRLWVAHVTNRAHLEPGYDATQWTFTALGRNLDQSAVSPTFFQ